MEFATAVNTIAFQFVTDNSTGSNRPFHFVDYYDVEGKVIGRFQLYDSYGWQNVFIESAVPIHKITINTRTQDQPGSDPSLGVGSGLILVADLETHGFEYVSPATEQVVLTNEGGYYGGDADNIFSVRDVTVIAENNDGLHGGHGMDTVKLTGANQQLDLTALGDKVTSIEVIDLTGSGDNNLKLALEDVLNHGETDLFHTSGNVQMMIKGDAGDVVDLKGMIGTADPGNWANQGQVTVGGVVYDVYEHSTLAAELLVQQGVTTNLI